MSPEILRTRIVHSGWCKLMVATVRHADGSQSEREIEDHGQAVAVLPYDPERRVALLVRLFRPPVLYAGDSPELLEAPAGMMDEDDPEETVKREALEEAGLRLGELEHVVTAWSSPGLSCERIALYLATYSTADRVEEGGGLAGEHENITVAELPLAELWSLAERQELTDLKTLTLVLALRQRRPELFQEE
jgi:nudix-type nucleoside diphosphatase (YffH/AdpP family)